MVSLAKKNKGFTIVELLIVIVVIGILATLVIVTFTGIQQKGRNAQRQTDINALNGHVEAYYAQTGYYPTVDNVNDLDFRRDNMKGLDPEALKDPKATGPNINDGASSATQYGYAVSPAGCNNTTTLCDTYVLTATLEGSSPAVVYTKRSN
ncbi:MAG: type II secretion system protein [Candidatus Saccharimonadales bacterium]